MTEVESVARGARRGTVLVTGGAGFIGSAISPDLADAFDRVVALDSLHPQIHATGERPASLDPRVELVVGDVTSSAAWDAVLRTVRPDVLVHLAAETGTGQSLEQSTRHATTNVVGTTQMLDALNRHAMTPARIVLASSRAVYGEGAWRHQEDGVLPGAPSGHFYPGQRSVEQLRRGEWDFPGASPTAMESSRVMPAPVSVYGATKLAQEHLLSAWALAYGVEPVVLRLQNVYGPGQSLINPYTGIMSLFCRIAKAGQSIPLYEDGRVRRDFVAIDDVARALCAAATMPFAGAHAIDIGSGETQTIANAARIIANYYGAPEPHVTGQFRNGDVRHAWADVTAAGLRLGWEPRVTLDEGIRKLAQWIDSSTDSPR